MLRPFISKTQEELEEILEDLNEEFLTGVVSSFSSLGESAQFYRLPLEKRMEMVLAELQRRDPDTYGRHVKKGVHRFTC